MRASETQGFSVSTIRLNRSLSAFPVLPTRSVADAIHWYAVTFLP